MIQHGRHAGKLRVIFILFMTAAALFAAERRKFKPGFNIFSPAQDVEMGKEAAAQADKEFPIVKNKTSTAYLNELGKKLVRYAPGETDYPWEFKFVNAEPINAFALPGGFIYVNRGTVEAARNESELAGVIAHEIGHVVMRHSTNRASKAVIAQAPLRIFGGLLGGGAIGQLAQMGVGFGFNSVMLKYSRDAETQSDQIATYILFDAGYDPKSMATFFQILEQKYPKRTTQFFSSHPNPGNRVRNVEQEIPRLGPAKSYRRDTRAFRSVKRQLGSVPYSQKTQAAVGGTSPASSSAAQPPPPPSSRTRIHEADDYLMEYPSNWQLRKGEQETTFFPERGMVPLEGGGAGQAYGAVVGFYSPQSSKGYRGLEQLTQEFITHLRESNPELKTVSDSGERFRVDRRPAYSLLLDNPSPLQGRREPDWLVTLRRPKGLFYVIFVAPQKEFATYRSTFELMLGSIQFQ